MNNEVRIRNAQISLSSAHRTNQQQQIGLLVALLPPSVDGMMVALHTALCGCCLLHWLQVVNQNEPKLGCFGVLEKPPPAPSPTRRATTTTGKRCSDDTHNLPGSNAGWGLCPISQALLLVFCQQRARPTPRLARRQGCCGATNSCP